MRHLTRTVLFVTLLLAAITQEAAASSPLIIKLATLAPEGSSWHLILKEMGDQWRQVSNGRVLLKIYPGGVVGDETEMVSKMRLGTIHSAAVTGTGLSEIDRGVQALQLPMFYRSDAELDAVRDRLAPKLEERFAAKGFIVLAWGEAGWVYFFTRTPVVRPDDLKKQKLFTWAGDTMALDLWKAGGFKVVPLASTDIMPSLQTGMINAFATPPAAALSFQWYSLAPNMTDLRWAPLVGAIIIDKRTWDKIPADAREAIRAASRKAGEKLQTEVRKGSTESVKAMKEHRLTVVPVPHDAVLAWRTAAEGLYPKMRGFYVPADMFDEAKRLVEGVRSHGNVRND